MVLGIWLWQFGMSLLGDNAMIVGPDLVVKKALGLFSLGAALFVGVFLLISFFPTIWKYADPLDFGNKRESQFEKDWAIANPNVRICACLCTFLFVIYCCLVAFSA